MTLGECGWSLACNCCAILRCVLLRTEGQRTSGPPPLSNPFSPYLAESDRTCCVRCVSTADLRPSLTATVSRRPIPGGSREHASLLQQAPLQAPGSRLQVCSLAAPTAMSYVMCRLLAESASAAAQQSCSQQRASRERVACPSSLPGGPLAASGSG